MSNPTKVYHYVHPHGAPAKGKILMVASSPALSGQTGWPIGFWAAELTHRLHVFQETGYEIVAIQYTPHGIKLSFSVVEKSSTCALVRYSGYNAGDWHIAQTAGCIGGLTRRSSM
jgi:hypothetical protein